MIPEDHENKGNGGQEALIVKKFPWSIPKEMYSEEYTEETRRRRYVIEF